MSERPALRKEAKGRTGPKRRPSRHRRAKLSGWSSRWPHRPRCRGTSRRGKRGERGERGRKGKGRGRSKGIQKREAHPRIHHRILKRGEDTQAPGETPGKKGATQSQSTHKKGTSTSRKKTQGGGNGSPLPGYLCENTKEEDKDERRKKTQNGGIGSSLPGYLCKNTRKKKTSASATRRRKLVGLAPLYQDVYARTLQKGRQARVRPPPHTLRETRRPATTQ